jgi:hypothetical protein
MPASIEIAGIEVDLVSFQQRPDARRGEMVRAFDNTLLDGTDRPKRTWDGTTDWMTPASEQALRAAVGSGPVVCTGFVLSDEQVLCSVSIEAVPRGPDVLNGRPDYAALNVTLPLVLTEV